MAGKNVVFMENDQGLSSPEQLDQLMRVTSPRSWVALISITLLIAGILAWLFLATLPTTSQSQAILLRKGSVHRIAAPVAGLLKEFPLKYNEKVTEGQVVATILTDPARPNSTTVEIRSQQAGIVVKKLAREGDVINVGDQMVVLEPADKTLEVLAYVPLLQARNIRKGMDVQISPTNTPQEVYGFLLGKVRLVSQFPAQSANMQDTLGNDELVKHFLTGTATTPVVVPLEVRIDLQQDPNTASGYAWSSGAGPNFNLVPETLATATFVLGRQRPISLLIPDAP